MDFLDPKKKRAHRIRLYVGYILMAIALSIGTLILLFEAFGYDVNRKTGQVIQNGLVFLDTHPESAKILVNGKNEGQTGTRLVLPTGRYDVELQRDGYRTWKRSFELEGSIIERLTYPFLFPDKLEPADVQLYASMPAFASQSPDRKWLLVQKPGTLKDFDIVDLSNTNNPTTALSLPENLLTPEGNVHKLETAEWSNDNRHVLLKHTYGDKVEFVMVDREQAAESFNVNKTFNLTLSDVALRDKKFDQLHLLETNGGILRFGDARSKEVTLMANRVRSFKSYGDDVLIYVTEEGAAEGKALVNVRRGNDTYKLRDLPKGITYVTDITRFDDRWYLAAGGDAEHKVYVYEDPFDIIKSTNARVPAPTAILKVQKLEHLSVSANTRFIGLQGGSEFAVYDAEHDRTYRYDTKLPLAAGLEAKWMDGHRYSIVSENQLVVFDYDGINTQKLTGMNAAFQPFFDRDYDNLYGIGPSAAVQDKPALTRTPMRIQADR